MNDNKQRLDLFQKLIDQLSIGILILNLEKLNGIDKWHLYYSNSSANNFLDMNIEKYWGRVIADIFPGIKKTDLLAQISAILKEQIAKNLGMIEYQDANLSKNIYSVKVIPLDERTVSILFRNIADTIYTNKQENYSVKILLDSLTAREHAILEEMITAKTSKSIAKKFNISLKTVETHRKRILQKMGVSTTVELTAVIVGYRHSTQHFTPNPFEKGNRSS